MNSKTGYLADEGAQQRLRVRVKDQEQLLKQSIRDVLATPQGRHVFGWLIFERCFHGQHRFDPNNAHATYMLGIQSVAQMLHDEFQTNHVEHFDLLVREHRAHEATRELLNDQAKAGSTTKEQDNA